MKCIRVANGRHVQQVYNTYEDCNEKLDGGKLEGTDKINLSYVTLIYRFELI